MVPVSKSIRESLAGSHLLVTGVTGFLGKVWLTMVLEHVPQVGRISVLIRSRKGESAQARFRYLAERSPAFRPLRAKHGQGLFAFLDDHIDVLEGDVAMPFCGLSEKALTKVAASVDAVVHFAGLTDFEPDPIQGIAINTRGGENAADVAARLEVPRLIHVSTAFVAGNVSGEIAESIEAGVAPSGIRFDPHAELEALEEELQGLATRGKRTEAANLRAAALGWPNIYTYTKGLSEHLHASRDDIDLTIIRPAVVESSRSYPFEGWNEGINTSGPLVWLLSSWFRHFPSTPKHRFDVVPVDTVARGAVTVLAAALRGEAEPVYQFGSSANNPLTFERAIDLTALGARRMHSGAEATPFERFVLKHMDAVARDADREPFPSIGLLRKGAQRLRRTIKGVELEDALPPNIYRSVGERMEQRLKSWSMAFRNADRNLGRIEDMLRLYRPFIHDNDYVFENAHILAASAALPEEERALFGFDIDTLDWRTYWLDVHIPGLEKWSLPLLRGERVPDDPPMLAPKTNTTRSTARSAGGSQREPTPATALQEKA